MQLRVLFVEDSEDDAALVLRELKRIGYEVEAGRVETSGDMQAALGNKEWDLIICDYSLPSFDAPRALEILKASEKDIPFIILSGTIGEETAVATLKAGAHDFLLKGSLTRLGPVMERELREAEIRRERKQAEEEIANNEKRLRALIENSADFISLLSPDGSLLWESPSTTTMLGYAENEFLGRDILRIVHPDDLPRVQERFAKLVAAPRGRDSDSFRLRHHNDSWRWVDAVATNLLNEPSIQAIVINYHDITDRKQAEDTIRQHLAELEMLYESGLALNQLLNPKEIAQKIIALMSQKLGWHHIVIRLYRPENEMLELLAFNLPGDMDFPERQSAEDQFKSLIVKIGDGLTGWAVQHRQIVRIGELSQDGRYLEIIPGLHSGLYVPLQTGDHIVGVISIESEKPNAFSEADERLTATLANQAAIALENARLHEETLRQVQQLQALHAIDLTISSSFNQSFTLDVLLSHTINQLGADAASILLMQPHQQVLKSVAAKGFHGRGLGTTDLKLNGSFAGKAILERRAIHIGALDLGKAQPAISKIWSEEGFKSQHIMPLIAKGETRGVLNVFSRKDFTPTPAWIDFLEMLAGQAAIAVDNSQMFTGLQRANMELAVAYDATIEGWSQAMDLRDKETEGHTQRVTKMAVDLAKAMKFNDEDIIHVRRGALLHDVGKIGVPDHILLKPDKLTDEEWQIMRQHPQFAYDMLSPINYLHRALDIPYCHHEKWDGTGYPRGLKAEQIPLAARIFAVVDVWDAVTSDRPYRKAWSKEDALRYIREQSGKHFDPQVVDVFLREFGNA